MEFSAALVSPAISRAMATISGHKAQFLKPLLLGSAGYFLIDALQIFLPNGGSGLQFAYTALSILLQLWVIQLVLSNGQEMQSLDGNAFARLFGIGFLSGLAILVGLLLFILPGLYLLGRWSIAGPAMIAEKSGVIDSLKRSWHALEHDWLAGSLLTLLFGLLGIAPIVATMFTIESSAPVQLTIAAITNPLVVAAAIMSAASLTHLYLLLTSSQSQAADIFG